jgi:hypothetical protein
MPSSLVPKDLAAKCWSPELLQLWQSGKDIGVSEPGAESDIIGEVQANEMITARRKVSTLRGGAAEAVWVHVTSQAQGADEETRIGVTATTAAEFLLNGPEVADDKRVKVRGNTLPAFAAHTLLMARPDLFIADERDTWKSGFLARARGDRSRLDRVTVAVESDDSEIFKNFVAKANAVREALAQKTEVPEWSEDDLDFIWVLGLTIVETRSLQANVANVIASTIVKAVGYNIDHWKYATDAVAPFLTDIGVLPSGDSVRTSLVREAANRHMVIRGVQPEVSTPALQSPTAADAALDSLRQDSPHRVYVIDDASAKELDDGIAVEPTGNGDYWVHVHVADPTRYLARDDPVAQRAAFYGVSTYLPEGTTPLLPPDMGDGDMSLGESHKSQSVMVFSARVDKEGNIHDHKVGLGHLKSAVLTTYATVNKALGIEAVTHTHPFGIFETDKPATRAYPELTPEDVESLALLRDLANGLRAKRYANAGIEWVLPSGIAQPLDVGTPLKNMFDRAHAPASATAYPTVTRYNYAVEHRAPTVSAQQTVAELMILANRVVAKFCSDHNIPVPFRGSEPIHETSMTPAHLTLDKMLARREAGSGFIDGLDVMRANLTPPKTITSTTPVPHWIMGFDKPDHGYLRATSPLRRFDDMLVHWQVKAALAAQANLSGADKLLGEERVSHLAEWSDTAANRNKILSRNASVYWNAGLLLSRSTGALPAGLTQTPEMATADLHDIEATVFGPARVMVTGDIQVPTFLPSIGIPADVTFKHGAVRLDDLVIGARIRTKLWAETTYQWPNPMINFVPVLNEIVPPPQDM